MRPTEFIIGKKYFSLENPEILQKNFNVTILMSTVLNPQSKDLRIVHIYHTESLNIISYISGCCNKIFGEDSIMEEFIVIISNLKGKKNVHPGEERLEGFLVVEIKP